MRLGTLIGTILLGILATSAAQADKEIKLNSNEARELVSRGEIVSLDEIMRLNEAEFDGRIIEIELERKDAGYVYEIKLLRRDGRKAKLKIDGRSGTLIRSRM